MVSVALHLNYELKYDSERNIGKLPLRSILSKYVNSELINPRKQGFSVNTVNLWKTHGKKLCDYYLNDSKIVKDHWINQDWIRKHSKNLQEESDVRYVNKFLGLLAFEIWYRIFVTKEMDSDTLLKI